MADDERRERDDFGDDDDAPSSSSSSSSFSSFSNKWAAPERTLAEIRKAAEGGDTPSSSHIRVPLGRTHTNALASVLACA